MVKKILIVRFSSIGDIVLTTPVVRCLKNQLGVEIHFLTKKSFEKIVMTNPYIDQVYSIEKKISDVIQSLQAERYDCIIDLHNNLRSWQVKKALGVRSYSFNKLNWRKWLVVKLKINRLPNTHIVDRYLDTIKHLGVINDGQGLDYFIPKEDEVDVSNLLKTQFSNKQAPQYFEEKSVLTQPYIAFVIGAAHATKRLPLEKIIGICNGLKLPVLLLGGQEDATSGDTITLKSTHYVYNFCGKLNLNQSASVVKQAHRVITHDTGLMHIAAAFHKKIISIWGNTIPEFGMTAYTEGVDIFEVKDLGCRPCSKIGFQECPKGHFRCMTNQDTEAIVSASNE
jgi:ADP-heptose:LPS heptosyltransferase